MVIKLKLYNDCGHSLFWWFRTGNIGYWWKGWR